MSKKHFEEAARRFNLVLKFDCQNDAERRGAYKVIDAYCSHVKSVNPRFDRDRFMEAVNKDVPAFPIL